MMLFDIIAPRELNAFVRGLQWPDLVLARFLPERNIGDLDYRFAKGDFRDQDVAPFRGFDVESPLGKRQGIAEVRGSLPPISKAMMVGEEQRIRLQALLNGRTDRSVPAELIDAIFDDATNLTRAIRARMELARGELLHTGKVTINENEVQAVADFGLPAGNVYDLDNLFDDPDSDPIRELVTRLAAYVARTGRRPVAQLMSGKAMTALMQHPGLRAYAGVRDDAPGIIDEATIRRLWTVYNLPPIVTYDTVVMVGGVATRPIPDDLAIWLPGVGRGVLGETLYGVTAEALEQGGSGQILRTELPGIVAAVLKSFNPVTLLTNVSAIGLPVLQGADGIEVQTVLGFVAP